jgi:hypothetical protein
MDARERSCFIESPVARNLPSGAAVRSNCTFETNRSSTEILFAVAGVCAAAVSRVVAAQFFEYDSKIFAMQVGAF